MRPRILGIIEIWHLGFMPTKDTLHKLKQCYLCNRVNNYVVFACCAR